MSRIPRKHTLHASDPRAADAWLVLLTLLLAVGAVLSAREGGVVFASALAAMALLGIVRRVVRGPSLGPAVVEIDDEELVFRQPYYVPTRTQRFRLDRIRSIDIVGPKPGRCYRLTLADGSMDEVRPYYGWRSGPRVIAFVREHLAGRVPVHEEPLPGVLAQMRGSW